ncbi:tumor necrosis factor ligand superfamily member 4 [Tamandua tetradactyla]|uniref:tumor necrosis factor ligand superfamily member 4 n=1 Tax=Tamandua tetradactyla TaxID=48850 RepID=UPI0040543471
MVNMERTRSLDENEGNVPSLRFRWNKLLVVASVIQGVGLLLCLTYICLHFYASQVPPQNTSIQSIRAVFSSCENEKGCHMKSQRNNQETMKVQDNAIIINCDGFYLISLKACFTQEVSLSLQYRQSHPPLFPLNQVRSVDSITVAYLAYKDKVYLNVTTHNISYETTEVNGGELILIHQSPGEYCVH